MNWQGISKAALIALVVGVGIAVTSKPTHAQPTDEAPPAAAPARGQTTPRTYLGFCLAASGNAIFLSDVIRGAAPTTWNDDQQRWRQYLGDHVSPADEVTCKGSIATKSQMYEKRDETATELMRQHGATRRVYTGWAGS